MKEAMVGFNPELVTQSINAVQAAYEETVNAFFDGMQNKFVNRMSEIWACNVAVDFFNNVVKTNVDGLINGTSGVAESGINWIFSNAVSSINGAAQAWAAQTETAYQPQQLSVITKSLDVSNVRENINGIRGIDLQSVPSITSQFNEILGATTTALNKAVTAVRNSGFIGGAMQDSLINNFNVIRSKIVSRVGEINQVCQFQVNSTVEKYEDTAGRIAQAFAGE